MKVLFVATVVKTHINVFHLPFLSMFKKFGWETSVCARNDFENKADCIIPNCDKYYDLPFERSPFKINNLKTFLALRKIIKRERFDIIHCHTPSGGVLTRLASSGLRHKGVKVIYTAHGFHFYKGAPFINWFLYFPIEWVCSFFTDTLITINKEDYQLAKKYMHAKSVEYVLGVGFEEKIQSVLYDREKKRQELEIAVDEIAVLSVGELNDNKNHETILRAIASIEMKNIKYIICGTGDKENYLKSLAEKLGISKQVVFKGYRQDIAEVCKACDIFAFPSKREGLPVSVMEAMAAGLPVVCSNIRGNVDLIENEKNGYLCAFDNVNEFAQKIQLLCKSEKIRRKMSEENVKKVKEFSLNSVIDSMQRIYALPIEENNDESTSFASK